MNRHHPDNERIKRQYLYFLKRARGQSVDSVDAAAAALAQFEQHTRFCDFKLFRPKQATSFGDYLAKQTNRQTGKKLSKATLNSTLAHLRHFVVWLSDKPGYRSRMSFFDAQYFRLSEHDARIANARQPRPVPTLQQLQHVIASMPATTDIERRNRALVAFTLLTGSRDMAIASMKLKHVDLKAGSVYLDARDVKTKGRKSFVTYLMPVGEDVRAVFVDWVAHLRDVLLWGNDDPLFPSTRTERPTMQYQATGLDRKPWSTASPIREIFRKAFAAAGLPYFNPHSVRFTVARLGMEICRTPEEMKAWSKNIGHAHVMTTLASYGEIGEERQGEIIRRLGATAPGPNARLDELMHQMILEVRRLDNAAPNGDG